MIIDPYNFRDVEILNKEHVADETVLITTTKPANYSFLAGQYAIVKTFMLDSTSRIRQYSFAGSPSLAKLKFLIRRQAGGEVSNWFCDQAKPGDKLHISQPLGNFIRHDNQAALLIAGGVGVAPYMSMIGDNSKNLQLIYSERTNGSVCYHHELSDVLRNNLHVVISSRSGRINSSTLDNYDLSSYQTIYICGSKLFVDDINQLLIKAGVNDRSIKRELFTLQ